MRAMSSSVMRSGLRATLSYLECAQAALRQRNRAAEAIPWCAVLIRPPGRKVDLLLLQWNTGKRCARPKKERLATIVASLSSNGYSELGAGRSNVSLTGIELSLRNGEGSVVRIGRRLLGIIRCIETAVRA